MSLSERSKFVHPKESQLRNQARRQAITALCRWTCEHLQHIDLARRALHLFDANLIQDYSDDFDGEETFLVSDPSSPDGALLCTRTACQCDPENKAETCAHSLAACLFVGYRSHYANLSFEARREERRQSGDLLPLIKGTTNHIPCPSCETTISLEVSAHTEALAWMLECDECWTEFEVEIQHTQEPTPQDQLPPVNPIPGVSRWRWQAGKLPPRPRKIRDDQAQLGERLADFHVKNWRAAELLELGRPQSLELH